MNKKLKRKQALIMAEPYRTPFNSEVAKVSGDVIEDSVGGIKYATSFNGATKIVDANANKIRIEDGTYYIGKSVNLIKFDDVENATAENGVHYSIKDGIITFSGTPTSSGMTIHFNAISINVGDNYSIALFNQFTSPIGFFVQDKSNSSSANIYLGVGENIATTWTVADGTQYEAIVIYLDTTKTYTNEVIKPILVSGSTIPTKYYSGSYGIKIEVADGVVTCNGMMQTNETLYVDLESKIYSGIYSFNSFASNEARCDMYLLSPQTQIYNSNNLNLQSTNGFDKISFFMIANTDYDNLVLKPMLVEGSTAPTSFEPYFKNLLELEDKNETTTNGITYSIKDSIITLNGTSTETTFINLISGLSGRYYSMNCFNNASNDDLQILYGVNGVAWNVITLGTANASKSIDFLENQTNISFDIRINPNTTLNNATLHPILVKSSIIPTQFIPFANPYFVSLGQNGSVQYNGLEPREIDLKGNVISKINNQASDKLSNYALTKNTKVVDLGSLTWETKTTDTAGVFRMTTSDIKQDVVLPINTSTNANILCTKYKTISGDLLWRREKGIAIGTPSGDVSIYDPDYNTSDKLEEFKKAIRGTLLMYQTKNPTTINTTSFKTFKEDTNATISDTNFTSSTNAITETFKPTRSYDFKVNGFSNVVKSSNMFFLPNIASTTKGGITFSASNQKMTISGTSTQRYIVYYSKEMTDKMVVGKTYFLQCSIRNTSILLQANILKNDGTYAYYNSLGNSSFTWTSDFKSINIVLQNASAVGTTIDLSNITFGLYETDNVSIPYEPYFDPYIESFADKKNLIGVDDVEGVTIGGVTYSIKNGIITLNGTSSKSHNLIINLKNPINSGTYSFNAFTTTGSRVDIYANAPLVPLASLGAATNTKSNISLTSATQLSLWFPKDEKYYNRTFKPMLVEGVTIPTTFLPYKDKYSAFLNVKGKNLLNFENQSGTIPAGISYNVKNQVITLNGTAKDDGWVWFPFETTLNGTYSFKVITSKPISSSTTNKARISLDNPRIAGQVLVYLHQSSETTVQLNNFTCKNIGINSPINETWDDMQFSLILVEGDKIPEYEPYYSFTKEVLINQPLRKFDYLTYEGVYRQTNEITLDGSWNVVRNNYLFKNGMFICSIQDFFPKINNWREPYSKLYGISTSSDLPMISAYEAYTEGESKKGIAFNDGEMIIHLDDSVDNSLNNWTVEKINNYFKQNPITITYKTVDQTFEATSLTRLLFKNGYNKITPYDSINNNAIVEYLEYYKNKGD
jgi:hypothetical protein